MKHYGPGFTLVPDCGWPAVLTYEGEHEGITMSAVVEVSASGYVSVTTHLLADLRGEPRPEGPEGAYVPLPVERVHELVTAKGFALTKASAP